MPCRDNGVMAQLTKVGDATRATGFDRGLARVEGADGTLIAFATQPNRLDKAWQRPATARFTQALIRHLPTAGLELRTLPHPGAGRCRDRHRRRPAPGGVGQPGRRICLQGRALALEP